MLGGLLGGGLVSCILLALTMSNSEVLGTMQKIRREGNFGAKGRIHIKQQLWGILWVILSRIRLVHR